MNCLRIRRFLACFFARPPMDSPFPATRGWHWDDVREGFFATSVPFHRIGDPHSMSGYAILLGLLQNPAIAADEVLWASVVARSDQMLVVFAAVSGCPVPDSVVWEAADFMADQAQRMLNATKREGSTLTVEKVEDLVGSSLKTFAGSTQIRIEEYAALFRMPFNSVRHVLAINPIFTVEQRIMAGLL